MKTYKTSLNEVIIELTKEDIKDLAMSCSKDSSDIIVKFILKKPYIVKQFKTIEREKLVNAVFKWVEPTNSYTYEEIEKMRDNELKGDILRMCAVHIRYEQNEEV